MDHVIEIRLKDARKLFDAFDIGRTSIADIEEALRRVFVSIRTCGRSPLEAFLDIRDGSWRVVDASADGDCVYVSIAVS
jgi:hypothetical protein